ncbi:MAG TPA: hypothetical protein VN178_12590 [Rubrobacter sp.]|jgi:hypothetical protein|nr:hypothetical protein [Rubrobacter sp.]
MSIAFIGPPGRARAPRPSGSPDPCPRLFSGELVSAEHLLTVVDASRHMGEVTAEILEALGHPERPEYYASCQRV